MISYFASLIHRDAKHNTKPSKPEICNWWWPLFVKTLVLVFDRSRVSIANSQYYLLRKAKNALGANIFAFLKTFSVCINALKIEHFFLFLFSIKYWLAGLGVRIAHRETLTRLLLQKQSGRGMSCLPIPI